jgi:hypothetical protein
VGLDEKSSKSHELLLEIKDAIKLENDRKLFVHLNKHF